jgi:hypothetical protein
MAADDDTHAKLDAAMRGITSELGKRGIPYSLVEPARGQSFTGFTRAVNTVGGEYLPVEVKAERGGAMARMRGKIRIQVGTYGDKKQFPERKGGFDFAAIVDAIEAQLKAAKDGRKRDKERSKKKDNLDEALSRINEKLGESISNVRVFVDHNLHGINIHLDSLTEERANEVLTAIRKVFAS